MRAVIFDLDGTLVDTIADIASAMDRALAGFGLPAVPLATYRRLIGEGVVRLAQLALAEAGGDPLRADELVAAFRPAYGERLLDASAPYPGMAELVGELAARGTPLAVLSNKPDEPTRRIISALFPAIPWRAVVGERAGVPRKPDPTSALEIARALATGAADIAFVGDTRVDMETARAAGMRPIGVTWGFRPRAELVEHGAEALADDAGELRRLLLAD